MYFVKVDQGAPFFVFPSSPVESGRTLNCLLKAIMKTTVVSNHLSKFIGGGLRGEEGGNRRCSYCGVCAVLSHDFFITVSGLTCDPTPCIYYASLSRY